MKKNINWTLRTLDCNKISVFFARICKLQKDFSQQRYLLSFYNFHNITIFCLFLRMPCIYPDLQFRQQTSYATSTSSDFDSIGDELISSVNMEELENQDWKTYPFIIQKICGIRIIITSTNTNISITTTYNAVISRHQTEPSLGLTLSKVTRNDKLLTKDSFTVPYVHIQSIQL